MYACLYMQTYTYTHTHMNIHTYIHTYSHYLSVTPPNGGKIWLSGHPKAWEEWEMVRVGDKVAFKSHHGTWLSQK